MKKSTEQLLFWGAVAAGGYYLWKKHQASGAGTVTLMPATGQTATLMTTSDAMPTAGAPAVTQPVSASAVSLAPTSPDDDLEIGTTWMWGPSALVGGGGRRRGGHGGHNHGGGRR